MQTILLRLQTPWGGASPSPVSPPETLGFGSLSWGEISEGVEKWEIFDNLMRSDLSGGFWFLFQYDDLKKIYEGEFLEAFPVRQKLVVFLEAFPVSFWNPSQKMKVGQFIFGFLVSQK